MHRVLPICFIDLRIIVKKKFMMFIQPSRNLITLTMKSELKKFIRGPESLL